MLSVQQTEAAAADFKQAWSVQAGRGAGFAAGLTGWRHLGTWAAPPEPSGPASSPGLAGGHFSQEQCRALFCPLPDQGAEWMASGAWFFLSQELVGGQDSGLRLIVGSGSE